MLGDFAPGWRPKTRPRNKLRLNMKKILNPRLNTKEVTVLDDDSLDEKPLKTVKVSSLTDTKLYVVFLELRGELLKEEQQKETEVSYSEDQHLMDKSTPAEAVSQENPIVHGVSSRLLQEDEDIFRRLDIPWLPSDMQDTTTGKAFYSEQQNMQKTIRQYKHQMDYMQEVNDGLILANRRLREDL